MQELINFIKSKCTQEEIQEIVNELSTKDKDEPQENNIPKTWEAYGNALTEGYYINADSDVDEACCSELFDANQNKNVLPTKELAFAFLAMMQLMSLRQAWIGDWDPDWGDITVPKYGIVFEECEFQVDIRWSEAHHLSFPTKEMAQNFLDCFKDLIEKAKVLI